MSQLEGEVADRAQTRHEVFVEILAFEQAGGDADDRGAAEPRGYPGVSASAIVSVTHGGPEGVRRLRIVNAQDVALTPTPG